MDIDRSCPVQVINVAVKGASALPIGVNINPAVIIVNPQGANTWVSLAMCALPIWCQAFVTPHGLLGAAGGASVAGVHHHCMVR